MEPDAAVEARAEPVCRRDRYHRVHSEVRFGEGGAEFSQLGRLSTRPPCQGTRPKTTRSPPSESETQGSSQKQEHPLDEETMERLNELREQDEEPALRPLGGGPEGGASDSR